MFTASRVFVEVSSLQPIFLEMPADFSGKSAMLELLGTAIMMIFSLHHRLHSMIVGGTAACLEVTSGSKNNRAASGCPSGWNWNPTHPCSALASHIWIINNKSLGRWTDVSPLTLNINVTFVLYMYLYIHIYMLSIHILSIHWQYLSSQMWTFFMGVSQTSSPCNWSL